MRHRYRGVLLIHELEFEDLCGEFQQTTTTYFTIIEPKEVLVDALCTVLMKAMLGSK
jgi:hypothetical protein